MDTLMGLETEYALSVIDKRGRRSDPDDAAHALLRLAKNRFPHLNSADGQGIFLANGGKFYIDVGSHPEYATPECADPWDLVRYTLAGDRIMAQLVQDFERSRDCSQALVFRGNTGYGGQPESWACHESYLCRRPPAAYADLLVPFLVSRLIFAGSGGLDPFSPGIAFTLSPRSHFLTTVTNGDTMHSRPILNLRDEPLAGHGYHRLHLICADALGSETAAWLRAGATALIIALIDAGIPPPQELALRDPLTALRTFTSDPTLMATATTAAGSEVSALKIQQRYVDWVGTHLRCSGLPDWASQVLEGWEQMLTLLQKALQQLVTVLDWSIKRTVYTDFCATRGVAWGSLPHWTHAVTRLDQVRQLSRRSSNGLTLESIQSPGPIYDEAQSLTGYLEEKGLDWCDLPRFLSLRSELQELDTRFLQLGGIFQSLDQEGVLTHQVLNAKGAIDNAVLNPPAKGRAAIRGRFVREMAKSEQHRCGWSALIDAQSNQSASLEDPFAQSIEWSAFSGDPPRKMSSLDFRSAALASFIRGDYEEANSLLQQLLNAGYELPSTHCHLARIALVTDDLNAVAEHTARAWELRAQAPSYIVPRIVWLQITLVKLQVCADPLVPLIGRFKTAFQATEPSEWTMGPVMDHLRGRLSERDHALLANLAALLTDRAHLSRLSEFPEWQATPHPLD